MDIVVFIIASVLLAWLIFYRYYQERLEAACSRIKSKGWRNTIKVLLKVTYVLSIVITILLFIKQVASLFSKGDKT